MVGGIVGLAIIALGILWYYRRRRRATKIVTQEEPGPGPAGQEIQELPSLQDGAGLKQMPGKS